MYYFNALCCITVNEQTIRLINYDFFFNLNVFFYLIYSFLYVLIIFIGVVQL